MRIKLLAIVGLLYASCSFANDNDHGLYFGISIGNSTTQYMTDLTDVDPQNGKVNSNATNVNSLAMDALIGYQFNRYLGLELNYMVITPHSSSNTFFFFFGPQAITSSSFLTANIKGILPLTDKFSLFAKGGLGYNSVSVSSFLGSSVLVNTQPRNVNISSTNLAVLLGVGASYNLTDTFSVNIADNYYLTFAPTINSVAPTADDLNQSISNFGFGNTNYLSLGMQYLF